MNGKLDPSDLIYLFREIKKCLGAQYGKPLPPPGLRGVVIVAIYSEQLDRSLGLIG